MDCINTIMTTYHHIFPTCIASDIRTDLADELYPIANEYLEKYGSAHSYGPNQNAGHWTTYYTQESAEKMVLDARLKKFYEYYISEARTFLDAMNTSSSKYRFNFPFSFFAKLSAGSKHELHSHPGSVISGVFYIRAAESSPPIVFKDPRPYYKFMYYDTIFNDGRDPKSYSLFPEYVVKPKTGMLLLFPSWLEHEVLQSTSDEERITMVFNLDA